MANLLRIIFYTASAVSIFAALMTTASMFIADRTPQGYQYWIVTIVVSLTFVVVGLLLHGIARHASEIGLIARSTDDKHGIGLRKSWGRLAIYLSLGGLMSLAVLLVVAYAIVARINQGFAVFG
jgi:hypothetical protein